MRAGEKGGSQFVAGFDHHAPSGVDTQVVGAGIMTAGEFARSQLGGLCGIVTRQQLATEQSARAGLRGQVALEPVGDADDQAVFVDAEPGSAGASIEPAQHAWAPRLHSRRSRGAIEILLAISGDQDRRFSNRSILQSQHAHRDKV